MSYRKKVAQAIREDHPNWTVADYYNSPDTIPNVHFSVWQEGFSVNDTGTQITYQLKARVLVKGDQSAGTEDRLDEALDAALLTLQKMPDVFWDRTTRIATTDGPNYQGFEIDLAAVSKNTYRTAVLAA